MKPLENLITRVLDDGLVVARPGGHRLFVMNASARFIWENLTDGADAATIPALMAAHYGIDIKQADVDFRKTLRRWQQDGLAEADGRRRHYLMAGSRFSIAYPEAATEATIAPIFRHLETTAPTALSPAEAEFAVGAEDGQWVLRADGVAQIRSDALDAVVERLAADIVMHCYDRADWTMSTHAAAVASDCACVVLPGASGAGKSTLAAALLGRGRVRYMTDDVVLFARDTLDAIPMPTPLVLKHGSWRLLDALVPALARRPIHRRNNTDVRFWTPERSQVAATPLPVAAVVFPDRRDGATAALSALSPLQGLNRILSAPATVDRLMQWAQRIPFYHLAYDGLDAAAAAVEALLAP